MNTDFSISLDKVPTPCHVIDLELLEKNLKLLRKVQERTGCKILLALKAFATYATFPLIREYLAGVCASSVNEARLGKEQFGREIHAYAPAYSRQDIEELIPLIDHISFNSFNQWKQYRPLFEATNRKIHCGLRINPEHSETEVALYDPCHENSRLGITQKDFQAQRQPLEGIDGLHFHTLCEKNSDALERTAKVFEKKFGRYLHEIYWLNMGGGHHITRKDYDIDRLCRVIDHFKATYNLEVYLEPGEAVVLNTGFLVASVLDLIERKTSIAILDTSATAHMPDILEMPYRPNVIGSGKPGEYTYSYQLGGLTCLAGDTINYYSFPEPLQIGDKIVFTDMAHYTMVKSTTFNGVQLPAIATFDPRTNDFKIIRQFGYEDYKLKLS
jgi:carboxynorspermidine decarboxylase